MRAKILVDKHTEMHETSTAALRAPRSFDLPEGEEASQLVGPLENLRIRHPQIHTGLLRSLAGECIRQSRQDNERVKRAIRSGERR